MRVPNVLDAQPLSEVAYGASLADSAAFWKAH
jgi:hypothetical protein